MSRRQMLAWLSAAAASLRLRGQAPSTDTPGQPVRTPSILHPNDRWIALPSPKGDPVELWDIITGERARILPATGGAPGEGRRGLGDAMKPLRHGNYEVFQETVFTNDGKTLVGSQWDYDTRWSWVVELTGKGRVSSLAGEANPSVNIYDPPYSSEYEISYGNRWVFQLTPDAWIIKAAKSGAELARLSMIMPGPLDRPYGQAKFSPAGRSLAVIAGPCHYDCFSFSPQRPPNSAQVWLWRWAQAPKTAKRYVLGSGDIGEIKAIDEDRWIIAHHRHTCSTRSLIRMGWTRLIELPTLQEFKPSIGETQPCVLAVDSLKQYLVVQYGAGTVRVYDLSTRRLVRLMTAFMPPTGLLAWGGDSQHLLAARPHGYASLWNRKGPIKRVSGISDELVRPPITELARGTRCLAWAPSLDLVVQGLEDGGLRAFRPSTLRPESERDLWDGGDALQKPLWSTRSTGCPLRCLAFLPGDTFLASLDAEGLLRLWSLADRRVHSQARAHPVRGNALAVDPTGTRIYTGGHDGACAWSLPTLTPLFKVDTETQWVSAVVVDARSNTMIAGCLDGIIRAFQADTGAFKWKAEAHGGWVGGFSISPDGVLASGGEDGRILLWEPSTGKPIASAETGGHLPAWSRDGQWLAVYAQDRVRVLTKDLHFKDMPSNHLHLDWGDDWT